MKQIIIGIFLISLMACGRNKVVITGRISNADTLMLKFDEVDLYSISPVDSIILNESGKFRFTYNAEGQGFYQLQLEGRQPVVLFPKPGQQIIIEADNKDYINSLKIDGSNESEQVLKLIRNLTVTKIKLDSISALFDNAASDDEMDNYLNEYEQIIENHRKFSIAFILTHYNSYAGLYALYQQYNPGSYVFYKNTDLQYFKIVKDTLTKLYPNEKHVIALAAVTDELLKNYNSQRLLSLASDSEPTLPKVALPNIAGDTVTLESLKGRVVLLYFWASWNEESVDMNTRLIEVYQEYRNRGFEVLAVSLDNSVDSWTRAIKFDNLNWINLIDDKFPSSLTAANYNVTSLPTSYLIDRDNSTIIAKNLSPAQLRERLQDLLQRP